MLWYTLTEGIGNFITPPRIYGNLKIQKDLVAVKFLRKGILQYENIRSLLKSPNIR